MSIRFSNHTDIPKLRQIMKIVFGDNDLFLDHFFKYKYENNALVYELNDQIVSSAFLLDSRMENAPISYIYGCATLPSYRGNGIMNEILDFAFQKKIEQNFSGLCLVPASESLFQYYKSLGFRDHFYRKKTIYTLSDFNKSNIDDLVLKPFTPSEYSTIKNQYFSIPNSIVWDLNHYKMVEKEYVIEKGGFFGLLENQKIVGLGFFYTHHFKTYISELLTLKDLKRVANLFFNSFETNEIEMITPEKEERFGMIKWNEKQKPQIQNPGFISYALD